MLVKSQPDISGLKAGVLRLETDKEGVNADTIPDADVIRAAKIIYEELEEQRRVRENYERNTNS